MCVWRIAAVIIGFRWTLTQRSSQISLPRAHCRETLFQIRTSVQYTLVNIAVSLFSKFNTVVPWEGSVVFAEITGAYTEGVSLLDCDRFRVPRIDDGPGWLRRLHGERCQQQYSECLVRAIDHYRAIKPDRGSGTDGFFLRCGHGYRSFDLSMEEKWRGDCWRKLFRLRDFPFSDF